MSREAWGDSNPDDEKLAYSSRAWKIAVAHKKSSMMGADALAAQIDSAIADALLDALAVRPSPDRSDVTERNNRYYERGWTDGLIAARNKHFDSFDAQPATSQRANRLAAAENREFGR